MNYEPRPLPGESQRLCTKLDAPARLVAHLTLVHDTAVEIVEGLKECFPDLEFDADAVLIGTATHDMGKVLHPEELTGPGNNHETDGPAFLEQHGVSPHLARFARTHGVWPRETLPLEDRLVALADAVWKGQRLDELETLVVRQIAQQTGIEQWEVFAELDQLLGEITNRGEERLAWQATQG